MTEIKLKKRARDLSYRRRYLRITSHEQVHSKELKIMILALMIRSRRANHDEKDRRKAQVALKVLTARYLQLVVEPNEPLEPPVRYDRTIEDFTASTCKIFFGFNKRDLLRLFEQLRFPDIVRFTNRSKMRGEEVFLRGLYELVSGETQHKIAHNVFGRELTAQSRAFTWFINHLYDNFQHLVHDNLSWWKRNGFFRLSAEAIGRKMAMSGDRSNLVAHFIDCNCLPTSVTGGGPAEAGANSARWDATIQRAFYNGWKSVHGLKHQTVDNAYGMTVDMCGPTSLRRNDLAVLRNSDINDRMANIQEDEEMQYTIFGDSAYKRQSHLSSYFRQVDAIKDFRRWNSAMKKVRISIEWNYGYTASIFKYVQNEWKMKILLSEIVAKVYTVVTLLRNFLVAIYGGQTSNYFNVRLPYEFLEHYINQTDL
jgi:hypothetical protein